MATVLQPTALSELDSQLARESSRRLASHLQGSLAAPSRSGQQSVTVRITDGVKSGRDRATPGGGAAPVGRHPGRNGGRQRRHPGSQPGRTDDPAGCHFS